MDLRLKPKPALIAALTASAALLVALDQWTKALAAAKLAGQGVKRLLGDFAILVYTSNRGAFLSLGSSLPPFLRALLLVALPIGALVFLAWAIFATRKKEGGSARPLRPSELAATVLVASGGIGNLIDRLAFGEVRDFLNFGIGRLRTGIMNVADLYILAAIIVFAVAALGRSLRDGKGSDRPDPIGGNGPV